MTPPDPRAPGAVGIDAAAAQVAAGVPVVDVREDAEWVAGHIAGARHVRLAELTADQVPATGPVLVVCRSGGRSGAGAQHLAAAGIEAYNVLGGMSAWAEAGHPMVSETGREPEVV